MRRILAVGVGMFVLGVAVGWVGKGSPRTQPDITNDSTDPRWQLGQRFRVGFADPLADQYRSDEIEIVRIVQEGGPTLQTPDGHADRPRTEWKFHYQGRTYFAVVRK